jgi:catechol 2,3-dioxygenase-like lactoylglutathione lyase family enzyme
MAGLVRATREHRAARCVIMGMKPAMTTPKFASLTGDGGPRGTAMARITAIGGVFFHSPNPRALAAWYRDTLGLTVEEWGGAMLGGEGAPPQAVWAPFDKATGHFRPSSREFMINFAVDDLDAFLAALEVKGVAVNGRQQMDGLGKFAWILDPDGTKIELWQPE